MRYRRSFLLLLVKNRLINIRLSNRSDLTLKLLSRGVFIQASQAFDVLASTLFTFLKIIYFYLNIISIFLLVSQQIEQIPQVLRTSCHHLPK